MTTLRQDTGTRERRAGSELGLYARVFAVNAAILVFAVSLLAFTPASIDETTTRAQFLVLAAGLAVMLAANALLLRLSLAPLRRLTDLMKTTDLLRPGARLRARGSTEVSAVIAAFNATLERLEEERRSSTRRMVRAQESERRRIAQELHDEIGQNLTAVMLELKRAQPLVQLEVAEILADAQELARESLEELRRISYQLRPAVLDDLGLGSALTALCTGLSSRTGIPIDCQVSIEQSQVGADEELALYRIAQEALTNAVRHAQCSRITVELSEDAAHPLVLSVADDGAGMDAAGSASSGIRGMRERALMIGARLTLRNAPAGGVEVLVEMGGHGGR